MYTLKGAHENKRLTKRTARKKTTENGPIGCVTKRKSYSSINMRQLNIFSIKPKLDIKLFVEFCIFSDCNLKLFLSGKFSQI